MPHYAPAQSGISPWGYVTSHTLLAVIIPWCRFKAWCLVCSHTQNSIMGTRRPGRLWYQTWQSTQTWQWASQCLWSCVEYVWDSSLSTLWNEKHGFTAWLMRYRWWGQYLPHHKIKMSKDKKTHILTIDNQQYRLVFTFRWSLFCPNIPQVLTPENSSVMYG